MKKLILAAAGMVLALLCGCTRIETEYVDVEKEVAVEPLASYGFDGKSYTVHTLVSTENDDYVEFLIAREPEAPFSSYLVLSVMKEHLGKTIDFSNNMLINRVDYLVIFEDTTHYYPSEYAPKKGSLTVKKSGKGYSVELDARYIDGKEISFRYDGEFSQE